MKRLETLRNTLQKIDDEILDLDKFRDTPTLRKFRRQLQGEASEIRAKIAKLAETQEQKNTEHQKILERASRNRSSKMRRNWNYLRAIQANYFPNLSLKEIRKQHKLHRQGLESSVSDVAWKNPSP